MPTFNSLITLSLIDTASLSVLDLLRPSVLPSLRTLSIILWMRSCWTDQAIEDLNESLANLAPQLESFIFLPSAQITLWDVDIFRWLSPKLKSLVLPLDSVSPLLAAIGMLHADIRLSAMWLYCANDLMFENVYRKIRSALLGIDEGHSWTSPLFSSLQLLALPAMDSEVRVNPLPPPSIRVEERQLNYDDFDVLVEQLITGAARLHV